MRHSVAIALACVTLVGCTKTGPSVLVGGRHPWTIPHVLRIAEMSDPDRLNPYLSEMGVSYDLSSLVYSYLVIADNRGRLIGDLASTVPSLANGGISRDGRTYVYRLRQNVLWQDGVPFTARDVVASWEAVMNPRNNTFEREGYDRVASIEAASPTTVMVRLRKRYPPFISRFFTPLQEGAKPVLPAHVLEREHNFNTGELADHPVGTGPFRFISWVRGDRIVLRRFDRYFKGRPRLAQIEMRFIPDAQTTAAELETHQIDLIAVPQNSLDQYRSVEGVVVETGAPTNGQSLLLINVSKPTLRGLAVRRAIAIRRHLARRGPRSRKRSSQRLAVDRDWLRSAAPAKVRPRRGPRYSGACRMEVRSRRSSHTQWRASGLYSRNCCGLYEFWAGGITAAVVAQNRRRRTRDQDLFVSDDVCRTERTALRGFLRPRVERRPPQLGSRPVQSLGLRSLVPTGAKHLSLLRSTSRCARTQRPANRRPVASRPHLSEGKSPDMVGNPVRSFIPWTRPNCTLRRLAQLQR